MVVGRHHRSAIPSSASTWKWRGLSWHHCLLRQLLFVELNRLLKAFHLLHVVTTELGGCWCLSEGVQWWEKILLRGLEFAEVATLNSMDCQLLLDLQQPINCLVKAFLNFFQLVLDVTGVEIYRVGRVHASWVFLTCTIIFWVHCRNGSFTFQIFWRLITIYSDCAPPQSWVQRGWCHFFFLLSRAAQIFSWGWFFASFFCLRSSFGFSWFLYRSLFGLLLVLFEFIFVNLVSGVKTDLV